MGLKCKYNQVLLACGWMLFGTTLGGGPAWAVDGLFVSAGTGMSAPAEKSTLRKGRAVRMEVGQADGSLGYGVFFQSSVHNGLSYEEQGANGCFEDASCIQGDSQVYLLGGMARYQLLDSSVKVFGQVAAGLASAPLLMDEKYYSKDVVEESWNGNESTVHGGLHPFSGLGVHVEYAGLGFGVSPYLSLTSNFALGMGLTGEMMAGLAYEFGVESGPDSPRHIRRVAGPEQAGEKADPEKATQNAESKDAEPKPAPEKPESDEKDWDDW